MNKQLPPRPSKSSPAIVEQVALRLAKDIHSGWADGDECGTVDEIAKDLVKALRFSDYDGYSLAKELDIYYSPDAALVDILDAAGTYAHNAYHEACKNWVSAYGLKGPVPGTYVVAPSCSHVSGVGRVIRNWEDGTSTVNFPASGHVVEGAGTRGAVINWELLEPAPPSDIPREIDADDAHPVKKGAMSGLLDRFKRRYLVVRRSSKGKDTESQQTKKQ